MSTAIFVCTECSEKHDLLSMEQLALGYIGIHGCQLCGRKVDSQKERYNCYPLHGLEKRGLKVACESIGAINCRELV